MKLDSCRGQTVHVLQKEKNNQTGAELCQDQDKLGWPASSFSLRFKLFMSFKIGTIL